MLFSQSTPSTDSNHATPMQKFQNISENQILFVKPYPNLTNQIHKINSTHTTNSECTFISNKPECYDILQFSNYAPNTTDIGLNSKTNYFLKCTGSAVPDCTHSLTNQRNTQLWILGIDVNIY
ncbi:hypothetical protein M9Y10_042982 [Tritrichomonas musculus]|uniref:Uncharacterized protein n=1 Tax=Tritrichomonas musculus TaxID=1915356 RepID=A0ABR2JZK6_9EUKA